MKSKYIKVIGMEKKTATANKVMSAVGLFVLVVAVGVFVVYNPAFERHNIFVVLTFFINIVLFVTQLLASTNNHSFGFKVIFWTFNLFFFGLAPFYQYVSNSYIWGYRASDREYVINNVYILFWSIVYIIGTKIKFGKRKQAKTKYKKLIENVEYDYVIRRNCLNVMLILSVLVVAYYMIFVGYENMFFRNTSVNKALKEIKPLLLLEDHIFKNITLFTFVLHIVRAKQQKILSIQLLISAISFLITNFPTGITRFAMAAIYAGLIIIVIDNTRKGRWFITVFILALVVVFPAIDIFRSENLFESVTDFGATIKQQIEGVYTTGDYDSYSMFINVRRYIKFFDFSYGRQLLGAALFFVPRAIWSSKPSGTGSTVFLALHPEFTNVSAPLIAEGYVDFGIIGVVVYALINGVVNAWADRKYWTSENPLSKERIVYPFLIIQFFFLLRGDLMSGGAYFVGRMVMGLAIYYFVVKKVPINKKEAEPIKPRLSKYIKQK